MIRKFNYTGRKRIDRSKIQIRLVREEGEAPSYEASLDLQELDLPDSAKVFVEAYDKSSYMRFEHGTVGHLVRPKSTKLEEVQSRDSIFFRVKVVDTDSKHGRVLAIADSLPPVKLEAGENEKEGLLGVRTAPLGDQIWRLDFSGTLPLLELNEDLESLEQLGLKAWISSDGIFASLVFPAVVHQIFSRIVLIDAIFEPSDGDEWQSLWLQYASQLGVDCRTGMTEEQRMEWVEEVVTAFCLRNKTKERFLRAKAGDSNK